MMDAETQIMVDFGMTDTVNILYMVYFDPGGIFRKS